MEATLKNIDWELLKDQKELLFGHSINERNNLPKDVLEAMDGIINILDSIQDYAVAEMGVDGTKVFNSEDES